MRLNLAQALHLWFSMRFSSHPLLRLDDSFLGDPRWPVACVPNGTGVTDHTPIWGDSRDAPDHPIRRIALYSHDTQGLGHLRRNLVIARALSKLESRPTVLMICGAREAGAYTMPDRVDCITLPALHKTMAGVYRSRDLDLPTRDLTHLRSRTIASALEAFEPDLLIVDKVPLGVMGELRETLESLGRAGRTRCVLGLRDVLDEPGVVQREWEKGRYAQAITSFFDEVWVYGDPAVYDLIDACSLHDAVAGKARSLGYLHPWAQSEPLGKDGVNDLDNLDLPPGPMTLCLVGGGQDGSVLAEAFIRARTPAEMTRVLVTGPFMPAADRARLRARIDRLDRVAMVEFVTDPRALMARADRIISMGGYNTMTEVVALGVPALIVPRVVPRLEQLIRATRFSELGLTDTLHPAMLSPGAIASWLDKPCTLPPTDRLDFTGLDRLADRVRSMRVPVCTKETQHV